MRDLIINTDPRLEEKFKSYPKNITPKLSALRKLIIDTANEIEGIESIEKTLKWGEPSFLVKKGSTIRMDWKEKKPNQYALYFKCTSKLVRTFKEVYGDTFNYENTRAIVFKLDDQVPTAELKECIGMALEYHHLKVKPRLGK